MLNIQNLTLLVFIGLFLFRAHVGLFFLVATQFLSYLVPGLAFVSFFAQLPPAVTLLFFGSLLAVKAYRSRGALKALPFEISLLGAYLVFVAIVAIPRDPAVQVWTELPVLSAFFICIVALLLTRSASRFVTIVADALMLAFLLLLAGFALELVSGRSLADVFHRLGTLEVHASLDTQLLVLHGLLGNSVESAGALATLLPIFYLHSYRYRWLSRWAVGALMVLSAVVLVRSQNLTSLVALTVTALLIGRRRTRYIKYYVAIGLLLYFLVIPDVGFYWERLALKFSATDASSLYTRVVDIWIPYLRVWAGSWTAVLVGFGPDSWFTMAVRTVWVPFEGKYVPYSPHSLWIYYVFTQGVIGLAVMAYLLGASLARATRLSGLERACYEAGLVSFTLWSLLANAHRSYGLIIFLSLVFMMSVRSRLSVQGEPAPLGASPPGGQMTEWPGDL